jgi:hypothetical protein
MERTPEQVAKSIENHILGAEGPYDWDDFTSKPISDRHLDQVRLRCLELDYELPEERFAELRRIVQDLRTGSKAP